MWIALCAIKLLIGHNFKHDNSKIRFHYENENFTMKMKITLSQVTKILISAANYLHLDTK